MEGEIEDDDYSGQRPSIKAYLISNYRQTINAADELFLSGVIYGEIAGTNISEFILTGNSIYNPKSYNNLERNAFNCSKFQ